MMTVYDRQMLHDFLQQVLGELKLQQLELEGQSLPPGIQRGVEKFRNKWGGSTLVPPLNEFDIVLADLSEEAAKRMKELACTRKDQFDRAMDFIKVLKALGLFNVQTQPQ
jgi:hypothetical protein